MDRAAGFEEFISTIGVERSHLNRDCPRAVAIKIAEKVIDWQMLGYVLGLPRVKISAIARENQTEDQRKIAMFDEWKSSNGSRGTYLKLAEALFDRHRIDIVERLCKLLKQSMSDETAPTEVPPEQPNIQARAGM